MRSFKTIIVAAAIAWMFLCASGSALWADGCYLPDRAVKKIPAITSQRAILTYKGGIETLVISSALDSEAQKLGWLIPLPAVPTEMTKVDPGGLKTLEFCIQPAITHDLWQEARWVTIVVTVLVVGFGIGYFKRRFLAGYILLIVALYFLSGMLLPALKSVGVDRAAKVSSVRVEKTATVGAYDIAVLSAQNATDLNSWLLTNAFVSLPTQATSIVADYVRSNWVFIAIKLTRSESGASVPHPIKLVFPAREAVYPWRLTTLAGGKPLLELFVVGTSRAQAGMLNTEFAGRFQRRDHLRLTGQSSVEFSAPETQTSIAHPEILPLLWDNCVLTKLSGGMDANSMTNDLFVRWIEFSPYQQKFYTPTGAGLVSWIVFIWAFGLLIVYGMGDLRKQITAPFGWRILLKKRIPFAATFALFLACAVYLGMAKLNSAEVYVTRHRGRLFGQYFSNELISAIGIIIDHNPGSRGKDVPAIEQLILQRLSSYMSVNLGGGKTHQLNLIQGGDVCVEATPGNFTIEKRDGKITVRVYDAAGDALTQEY